jgi:phage recombination protein Bet
MPAQAGERNPVSNNNQVTVRVELPPALKMDETELCKVLQSSLYPGAQIESIKLVVGYCKAQNLDPMQKPVHIVPMKVSTGQKDEKGWDIKAMRDVIMPGVGLYRTQAARTQQYAGVSDPEFGPTKTLKFTAERWEDGDNGRRVKRHVEEAMDYPEWCRISVRRLVDGVVCEFPAREYWLENYATKGNDSSEPNAMWKKRPFGQIAKCAEAQALRKAFPEQTGSQPTAEEMEGKQLEYDEQPAAPTGKPAVAMPQAKTATAKPATQAADVSDAQVKGETAAGPAAGSQAPQSTEACSAGEIAYITRKLAAHKVSIPDALEACGMARADTLDGLTKDGFISLKDQYK